MDNQINSLRVTIGEQIRLRRKELMITQPDLADIASISVNTLYKIERGQANPTIEVLGNDNGSYSFEYESGYFANASMPEVSLTLPKTQTGFTSDYLFPFFFSLLSEGANKEAQCRLLKIDEKDYFGLLLATTSHDTIGAVTVKPIDL